jgi:hypothetical protein
MFSKRVSIVTLAAAAFMATLSSGAAMAQDSRIPPPPRGVLPCCNCLNEVKTASLNTGSLPWTVKGPGSSTSVAAVNSSNAAWTTTVIPTANWISPAGNPTAPGNYVYETRIDLRNCTLNSTVTISGKFLADNVGSVLVDGKPIISSAGTPNYGFLPGSLTNFSYTVAAGGVHTVTINAYNAGGPTGIIAEVTATRTCRGNPERDRRTDVGASTTALSASALATPVPCTNC